MNEILAFPPMRWRHILELEQLRCVNARIVGDCQLNSLPIIVSTSPVRPHAPRPVLKVELCVLY